MSPLSFGPANEVFCHVSICCAFSGSGFWGTALIGRSRLHLALWHVYFETWPSFVLFFFGMVCRAFWWFILVLSLDYFVLVV
jgi:hypothetical protein